MLTESHAIFEYLAHGERVRRIVYLAGLPGSGKTFLARQLHLHIPRRVITLCLSHPRRRKAQWVVTSDNAGKNGCQGKMYARDNLWPTLINDIRSGEHENLLLIIENVHWLHRHILMDIRLFMQHMPTAARLVLLGEPHRRQRTLLARYDVEILHPAALTPEELRGYIVQGNEIAQVDEILTDSVMRRIAGLCRGDRAKLGRAGAMIALLQRAEQTTSLSAEQWRLIYHHLGDRCRTKMRAIAFCCWSATAIAVGWFAIARIAAPLPLPASFIPAPPAVKSRPVAETSPAVMNEREALSLLFSTWGYDVSPDDAWCDNAMRAGLTCKTGSASLSTLRDQGLPWITTFRLGGKNLQAVVVRVSDDSLDVLIDRRTWTLSRQWFESVCTGNYTLLWKLSPGGERRITRDSSDEDILWLDTMLNRALNITASPTAEWRPLLVEKIKRFQRRHQIIADGIVGSSTLMRLWLLTGESARLFGDNGAEQATVSEEGR